MKCSNGERSLFSAIILTGAAGAAEHWMFLDPPEVIELSFADDTSTTA